jgi:hypothetical protein
MCHASRTFRAIRWHFFSPPQHSDIDANVELASFFFVYSLILSKIIISTLVIIMVRSEFMDASEVKAAIAFAIYNAMGDGSRSLAMQWQYMYDHYHGTPDIISYIERFLRGIERFRSVFYHESNGDEHRMIVHQFLHWLDEVVFLSEDSSLPPAATS